MMYATPLGMSDPVISEALIAVMMLDALPDAIVDNALRHLPRPHPSASAADSRLLLLLVRAMFGGARDGAIRTGPIVFAVGPLPVAKDSDDTEIRVDLLGAKSLAHAEELAEAVARAIPQVIAVALARLDGAIGSVHQNGTAGAPRVINGYHATAYLEDGDRYLRRSWFLSDDSEVFTLALDAPLTGTPAEA